MTRLVSIELRRLLSRRLVRVAAALVSLAIAIAGITVAAKSHRANLGRLRAQAAAEQQRDVEHCKKGEMGIPPKAIPPGESLDQFCEETTFARVSDPSFHLTTLRDVFAGTTVPLVLLAWLLAASFVGAEWHSGAMTTLLTWEPRRVRVLIAKAATCALVAFIGAVAFQVLLGLVLTAVAAFRGTTVGTGGRWIVETAGVLLRGGALAAIGAAVGFSIASVARNTAAALGVGFGYLLILENLIGALRPGWRSWFFAPNAIVLVDGHRHPDLLPRSVVEAGLLLAFYTIAIVAASTAIFSRRDVT